MNSRNQVLIFAVICLGTLGLAKKSKDDKEKPAWAKKDLRDYR